MPLESDGWIDVSVPIHSDMATWPGDPRVWVTRTLELAQGEPANVSVLSLSTHTGTHMDAPNHFLEEGKTIDEMPLDATVGPAHVVEVDAPETITAAHVEQAGLSAGDRVLFKTRNSPRCWLQDEFLESFVHLSTEAADALVEIGVRTVGIDYLSVAGYDENEVEVHERLLGAGIWIIEGLDLTEVEPGEHDLVCLPLKVQGADGAPARALLRPRQAT